MSAFISEAVILRQRSKLIVAPFLMLMLLSPVGIILKGLLTLLPMNSDFFFPVTLLRNPPTAVTA